METWHWVLVAILALVVVSIIPYAILKYAYHKPIQNFILYLGNILIFPFWTLSIFETPGKRREKLNKAGIKENDVIVDLGCGPGRFTFLAAKKVGPKGKVYALDIHPLHTAFVAARRKIGGYGNVVIVLADCCATGLPDKAIDFIFINDAFHEFDKIGCLKEAYRILKTDGTLAIDEGEMKEDKFLSIVEDANLFTLTGKDKRLYKFKLIDST